MAQPHIFRHNSWKIRRIFAFPRFPDFDSLQRALFGLRCGKIGKSLEKAFFLVTKPKLRRNFKFLKVYCHSALFTLKDQRESLSLYSLILLIDCTRYGCWAELMLLKFMPYVIVKLRENANQTIERSRGLLLE